MAIDRNSLRLVERTANGTVRQLTLEQAASLKAVPGAQYTLVDTTTGLAPQGMVLERVGTSLVIDIGGETAVTQVAEFYSNAGTSFFADGALPAAGASASASAAAAVITAETAAIGATAAGTPIVYAESVSLLSAAVAAPTIGLGTLGAVGGGVGVLAAAAGGGGGGGAAAVTAVTPLMAELAYSKVADGVVYTNDAHLIVSAPASGFSRTYSINGGAASSTYTPPSTDGTYTVVVTDSDGSGHSASATVSFHLLTAFTAPTLALAHDTGTSGTDHITSNANIAVANPAAGHVRTFSVDGGAPTVGYTAPQSAGAHTVVMTETDLAGNTTTSTLSFTLQLSVATPTVALAHDTGASAVDAITSDASLNVSAAAAGVTRTYSVDDGTASGSYTAPTTQGSHTVVVTDTDAAGNTAHSTTLTFTLDTVAPTGQTGVLAAGSDTGTSSVDHITSATKPVISGNAEANAAVSVVVGGQTLTATADVDGHYSVTVGSDLRDGSYTPSITVTDAAGNHSTADGTAFTIDTTAPAATIAITSLVTADNVVNIAESTGPAIAVTGTVGGDVHNGDTVTLTVNGNPYTGAVSGGAFSINVPASALAADTNIHASVTTTDAAGNSTTVTADHAYAVDLVAPAQPDGTLAGTPNEVAGVTYTNDGTINFTGLEEGATVQFSTDGGSTWTTFLGSSIVLPAGTYEANQLQVHQIDAAGNVSTLASNDTPIVVDHSVATPSLSITDTGSSNSDGVTKNTTITVHGLEDGATWQYTTNGGADWTVGSGNTFTVAEGTYAGGSLEVRQTDLAGNLSDIGSIGRGLTFDLTPPSQGTAAVTNNLTDSTTPVISGTADARSKVEITVDGHTYTNNADLNGHYSVTVTNALLDGSYTPTIKVTDSAGNFTTSSGTEFTVDTIAPTGQTGVLAAASDSGVTGDNLTNVNTPVISGTAEANAAVSVVVGGQTLTTTADGNGHYSVTVGTALHDGSYTPSITVTDAAGNHTTADGTAFTVDTTAPVNPTGALDAASDSAAAGDNLTNVNTPVISGTAEQNAAVSVLVGGQTLTTTADGDGHYSVTAGSTLSDGSYTPSITVTDAAGNSTTHDGTAFTVDTTPPVVTITSVGAVRCDETVSTQADDNQVVGTAEPLHDVTILNGDVVLGHTTADASGNWTYTLTAQNIADLGQGDKSITATQTDSAGNLGTSTAHAFAIDTVAPVDPIMSLATDTGSIGTDGVSNLGHVNVAGLEEGGKWQYSTDGGATWSTLADNTVTAGFDLYSDPTAAYGTVYAPGAVQVRQFDAAGNSSDVVINTNTFTIDTAAPADTVVNQLVTNNTVSHPAAYLQGTVEAGASLSVVVDGTTYEQGDGHLTVHSDGTWALDFNNLGLADGHYDVTAYETDLAGNLTTSTAADALWVANAGVFSLETTLADAHWPNNETVDFGRYVTVLGGVEMTGNGTVLFGDHGFNPSIPDGFNNTVTIGDGPSDNIGLNVTAGVANFDAAGSLIFDRTGIFATDLPQTQSNPATDLTLDTEVNVSVGGSMIMNVDYGTFAPGLVGPQGRAPTDVVLVQQSDITVMDGSLSDAHAGVALNVNGVLNIVGASQDPNGAHAGIRVEQSDLSASGDLDVNSAHIDVHASAVSLVGEYYGTVESGFYTASQVSAWNGFGTDPIHIDVPTAVDTFAALSVVDLSLEQNNLTAGGLLNASDASIDMSSNFIVAGNVHLAQSNLVGAAVDVSNATVSLGAFGVVLFDNAHSAYSDLTGYSSFAPTLATVELDQTGIAALGGDVNAANAQINVGSVFTSLGGAYVSQMGISAVAGNVTLANAGVSLNSEYFVGVVTQGDFGNGPFFTNGGDLHVVQAFNTASGTLDASNAHVEVFSGDFLGAGNLDVVQFGNGAGEVNLSYAHVDVSAGYYGGGSSLSGISLTGSAVVEQLFTSAVTGGLVADNATVNLQVGNDASILMGQPFVPTLVPAPQTPGFFNLENSGDAAVVQIGLFGTTAVSAQNAGVHLGAGDGSFIALNDALVEQGGISAAGVDLSNAHVDIDAGTASNIGLAQAVVGQFEVIANAGSVNASGASVHVGVGDNSHVSLSDYLGFGYGMGTQGGAAFVTQDAITAYSDGTVAGNIDLSGATVALTGGNDSSIDVEPNQGSMFSTVSSSPTLQVTDWTFQGGDVFVQQTDVSAFGGTANLTGANVHVTVGDNSHIDVSAGDVFVHQSEVGAVYGDVLLTDASAHVLGGVGSTIVVAPQLWEHTSESGYYTASYETVYATHWTTYDTLVDGTLVATSSADSSYVDSVITGSDWVSTGVSYSYETLAGDVFVDQTQVSAYGGNVNANGADALASVQDGGSIALRDAFVHQSNLYASVSGTVGGDVSLDNASAHVLAGNASRIYVGGNVDVEQSSAWAGHDISATAASAMVSAGNDNYGTVTGVPSDVSVVGTVYVEQHALSAAGNVDLSGAQASATVGDGGSLNVGYGIPSQDVIYVEQYAVTAGADATLNGAHAGAVGGNSSNVRVHGNVDVSQYDVYAQGNVYATAASAEVSAGTASGVTVSGDVLVEQDNLHATADSAYLDNAVASVQVGDNGDLYVGNVGVGQHYIYAGTDVSMTAVSAEVVAGATAQAGVSDRVYVDQSQIHAGGQVDLSSAHAGATVGDSSSLYVSYVDVYQNSVTATGGVFATAVSAEVVAGASADVSVWGSVYVDQTSITAGGQVDLSSAHAGATVGDNSSLYVSWMDAHQYDVTAAGDVFATAVSAEVVAGATADASVWENLYVAQSSITAGGQVDLSSAHAGATVGDNSSLDVNTVYVYQNGVTAADDVFATAVSAEVVAGATADAAVWGSVYVGQSSITAGGQVDLSSAHAGATVGDNSSMYGNYSYVDVDQNDVTATGDVFATAVSAEVVAGATANASGWEEVYVHQDFLTAGADVDLSSAHAGITVGAGSTVYTGSVDVSQYEVFAQSDIIATAVSAEVSVGAAASGTVYGDVHVDQSYLYATAGSIELDDAVAQVAGGSGSHLKVDDGSVYVEQHDVQALSTAGDVYATAVSALAGGVDVADVTIGGNVYVSQDSITAGGGRTMPLWNSYFFNTLSDYVTSYDGTVDMRAAEAALVGGAVAAMGVDVHQQNLSAGLLVDLSQASANVHAGSATGLTSVGIHQDHIQVGGQVFGYDVGSFGTVTDAPYVTSANMTGLLDLSSAAVDVTVGSDLTVNGSVGIFRDDLHAGLHINASTAHVDVVASSVTATDVGIWMGTDVAVTAQEVDASYNTIQVQATAGDVSVWSDVSQVVIASAAQVTMNNNAIDISATGNVYVPQVGHVLSAVPFGSDSSNSVQMSNNHIGVTAGGDVTIFEAGFYASLSDATLQMANNDLQITASNVYVDYLANAFVTAGVLEDGSNVSHNDVMVSADNAYSGGAFIHGGDIVVGDFLQSGIDSHATFWGGNVQIGLLEQQSASSNHVAAYGENVYVGLDSASNHIDLINVAEHDVLHVTANVFDWWTADVVVHDAFDNGTGVQSLQIDNIAVNYAQAFITFDATTHGLGVGTIDAFNYNVTVGDLGVAVNNEGLTWGGVTAISHSTAPGAVQYDAIDLHGLGITSADQLTHSMTIGSQLGSSTSPIHIVADLQIDYNDLAGHQLHLDLQNLQLDSGLIATANPNFWSLDTAGKENDIWNWVQQYALHLQQPAPLV